MSAPLPWSVALDPEIPDAGSVLVLDANGEVVADVGVLGRSREENEANARLIVGLLGALTGCRDRLQRVLDGCGGAEVHDELERQVLQSQVDVASALIARATRSMVGPSRVGPMEGAPGRAAEGAERSEHARASARPGFVAAP